MKQLSFGELLWDIIRGQEHIGGAPFNYACHAVRLGGEAHLASAVGDDELGRRALDAAKRNGVGVRLVGVNDKPTGTVPVELDENGVPDFDIRFPAAWDFIALSDADLDWISAQGFDVFYFGCLAMRNGPSGRTLEGILGRSSFGRVLCDVNLRQDYYDRERLAFCMDSCDVLKLNEDEARVIGRLFGAGEQEEDACRMAREEHGVGIVCVTAGEKGCRIYSPEGMAAVPGRPVQVADTVGAGDAFAAALMAKLGQGADPEEAGAFACRLGELVASRPGAVPDYDAAELEAEGG